MILFYTPSIQFYIPLLTLFSVKLFYNQVFVIIYFPASGFFSAPDSQLVCKGRQTSPLLILDMSYQISKIYLYFSF